MLNRLVFLVSTIASVQRHARFGFSVVVDRYGGSKWLKQPDCKFAVASHRRFHQRPMLPHRIAVLFRCIAVRKAVVALRADRRKPDTAASATKTRNLTAASRETVGA